MSKTTKQNNHFLSVLVVCITAYVCLTKIISCERHAIDQSLDQEVTYSFFTYGKAKEALVETGDMIISANKKDDN